MTSPRATAVTILAFGAVSAALTACGSAGKPPSGAKASQMSGSANKVLTSGRTQHSAYAYELPIDPNHPENRQWSTLVRTRPVTVGYRIRGIFPREWVVVAVKPLPQDGQQAAVRGWRGRRNPIWHGRLVLRLA